MQFCSFWNIFHAMKKMNAEFRWHYISVWSIISILIQSLKKISQKMLKIESRNKYPTSIKGHSSGLNWRNLPIYDPKPILPNINSYTKFEENRSKMLKIESGKEFLTSIKGNNLIDDIYPSTISNHFFLISTLIQNLKKISQKMWKIESGNKTLADGETDTQTQIFESRV